MGKLSFEGLVARDYPMVFTVMLLSAVLTLIGNLVADILFMPWLIHVFLLINNL